CPALGITIPVGKDSMSMRTVWQDGAQKKSVTAPLSLIISAFAPVQDVRKTVTPQLQTGEGDTRLLLIDLGNGKNRLGATALAQVYNQLGDACADVDSASQLKAFFDQIQSLLQDGKLLAYHDRSDGGLLATLSEMVFAGHVGVSVDIAALGDVIPALFNEELGAVIQVRAADAAAIVAKLQAAGLQAFDIGTLNDSNTLAISSNDKAVLNESRIALEQCWAEASFRIQSLRDNSECAQQEFDQISRADDPGISPILTFDPQQNIAAPMINTGVRPRVAILREQGVNGHVEMAAAFHAAGFTPVDVHMSDILSGRVTLEGFKGLVACGGFSYGDVLGAGEGWAKSILFNPGAREQFSRFFARDD